MARIKVEYALSSILECNIKFSGHVNKHAHKHIVITIYVKSSSSIYRPYA